MVKKTVLIVSLIAIYLSPLISQQRSDTLVYLLTCGPGQETYTIYGHSALRVVIDSKNSDTVYNWGVFDFSTPNFEWKFAKGRLDYMLGVESIIRFIGMYNAGKMFVYSQKINLTPDETKKLLTLINENLEPENIKYRYDFFYDNCSTRIRDLLEESVGNSLLYPPDETNKPLTFRQMLDTYQKPFPWLNFGINLLIGSSGDKQTSFRERMFLPISMQNELAEVVVKRDEKYIPILQNPKVILNHQTPVIKQNLLTTPVFVFSLLLILMVIISGWLKNSLAINYIDILIFLTFSMLSLLMIFFNFFTDHQQMKFNLNIIWLNPFIIPCLILLVLNKKGIIWFRILSSILIAFFVIHFILPQEFNSATIPLMLILLFRSLSRAGFKWNPFSL